MAEEEKEEEPKKGGLMKIIMMALGAIALIGVGVGTGYFLFGGKPADPSAEIEEIIERKMKEPEEAKAAEELTIDQYNRGVSTIFELLDAQSRRLSAESLLINSSLLRITNRIKLHLAISSPLCEEI